MRGSNEQFGNVSPQLAEGRWRSEGSIVIDRDHDCRSAVPLGLFHCFPRSQLLPPMLLVDLERRPLWGFELLSWQEYIFNNKLG